MINIWKFILFTGFFVISGGNQSKRLLLNDPTIFQDRLNRIESLLAVLNTTVKQQAVTIQQQAATIQRMSMGTGSTYIIWGRKQCPAKNGTEQVYSGYAGGGSYDHAGSAAEYVCLPPDPDFEKTTGLGYGNMYGAEYQTNYFGSGSLDEDVPCAVCRNIHASSTLMIPGKNRCYSGWNVEYHGYLASGDAGHTAASSFVCVDSHPEYLNAGAEDHNGKLFYGVLVKCGSLQCPPYINNYPLTCVVCSK